jgi:hypothetical protein
MSLPDLAATPERIRPFYCGSQYGDWQDRNCLRCTKYNPDEFDGACEIDGALGMGYLTDGMVTAEIARRMGYREASPSELPEYTWPCPDRIPAPQPGSPEHP